MQYFCCEYDAVTIFSQEKGYPFTIRGTIVKIKGTVAAISADNPAACSMAGFKEGSTATHGCRQCMATPQEIATEVSSVAVH